AIGRIAPPPHPRPRPGRADRGGGVGGPGQVRQARALGRRLRGRHRARCRAGRADAPAAAASRAPAAGDEGMTGAPFDRERFGAFQLAHPWALAALIAVPLAAWLLRRRLRRQPMLVVPTSAPARALPPSRWAR